MEVKKIIIFTSEPFPYGLAATNRIISYGKGFIKNGKSIEVICFRRTENREKILNHKRKGSYENINFKYIPSSTVRSNSFLIRRINNFFSTINLFFYGLKIMDRSTLSIYYSSNEIKLIPIWIAHKFKGGLLFNEESEHPEVYLRNKNIFEKFIFNNFHYNLFDGYLLMTKNLISYFKKRSNTPYLHAPMTVELDRFNIELNKTKKDKDYIVYTGFLDDKKDGIDILIKAFAGVVKRHKTFELFIYGPAHSEVELQKYYRLVEKIGISNQVHFKGSVTREVITNKIMEAKILVLPRPESLQAQHGFPTKLGEYLATGNPTLVTRVGEIPDYLTDGKNSYIAIPGDILSLENKMLEIIDNYPKARNVGLEGRKIAEEHFNNIAVTRNIITFAENSFN
jgi:glycosyltransferase involved in cell wall biosynthesis